MTNKELLTSLGLSSYEADVYEALLSLPRARVQDLARVISVPRPQIYVALGRLMDKGLCSENRGKVSHYTAAAPEAAFGDVLKQEEGMLKRKAEGVKRLARLVNHPDDADIPKAFVQVLRGRQVKGFMDEALVKTKKEIRVFFRSAQEGSERSLEGALQLEEQLLSRGVRIRCVYDQEGLRNPELVPVLRRIARKGEEMRVVPSVPMNAVIVDSRAALFSLTREKGDVTVFVFNHPALVETLSAGFEYLWGQGKSLRKFLAGKK